MPIPGAAVSISAASSSEKISTWTDVDGSYTASIPAYGSYTVRVQMAAFANGSQEIVIDASHQNVVANFELILLSRSRQSVPESRRATGAAAPGPRGFQSLSLAQNGTGQEASGDAVTEVVPTGMPVPGIAPDSATESVAVSGSTSNPFTSFNSDDFQQHGNDARQSGGGFGGPGGFGAGPGGAGGGGGGGRGFGRRGFDINHPHGSIYYGIGDSALNAAPYSLTGLPTTKPGYVQNSFGGSVGEIGRASCRERV
jgi:hypothetical protein